MWLATQHGFFSIVRKDVDLFFIRARVRNDLENLIRLADLDGEQAVIHVWPNADYRYRLMVDLEALLEIAVQMAAAVDYPNFKARVFEREDQTDKLGPYHRIWEIMTDLQVKEGSDAGP